MDAVILAAGLGKRLRPLTLSTPKPLLEVQGRPVLDWTLGALPAEVDRVIVVVHYLAEQVEAYLGRQRHVARWTVVTQHQPRGTGDALRICRDAVGSDRLLVVNGDDLFGARDLAALAARSAAILVHPVSEPRRFGIVFEKADGTLDRLMEKPDLEGVYPANTGAYLFPRSVFDIELTLSPRGEYEITDYVIQLAARQAVDVVHAGFWLPISTAEVLGQAQSMDLAGPLRRGGPVAAND